MYNCVNNMLRILIFCLKIINVVYVFLKVCFLNYIYMDMYKIFKENILV